MAKDKEIAAQPDKTLGRRNGRIKSPGQLRLLASRHVLRKPAFRAKRRDWR